MSVGKKLTVALSVMITGVSGAMFLSKDGLWGRGSDDPFAQQVERRVAGSSTWTPDQGATPRLPLATAAITQPSTEEPQPQAYLQSYSPVGSLLAPVEGIAGETSGPAPPSAYDSGPRLSPASGGSAEIRHRIADGDTLSRLAAHYLGRAELYHQIYEYNRDVLASPDLLPIGAIIRIPAGGISTASVGTRSEVTPASATTRWEPEPSMGMVPVPRRPQMP
jgi:hypothetical protein